ncbi:MAG TPA: peptidase MA family metallohydrolase [Dehalococcoidia bacterium]|nr:peptidase MA family metallohydrolase [Dehalococcoidia bacterium]
MTTTNRRTARLLIPVATLFAALLVVFAVAAPSAVHAGTIETDEPTEQTDDPRALTFQLRVRSSAGLESARLIYKVRNPDGDVGGSADGEFTRGTETDVVFTLEMIDFQRYIPVGSTIVYHWELEDRDGVTFSTEEREFTFLDGRYSWRTSVEGQVTAYWYGSNETEAMRSLSATKEALETVGALLETTVPYDVKVVVYGSESEGDLARRPRGVFDQQITTQGQRVAPDLIFVFEADSDVIRHETAHIVTHVAGDGPFTSLPSWLDEGTAVFAQLSTGPGYAQAINFALATDTTLSLRAMGAPSNRAETVNLFYGESHSVVDYLVEIYGQQQFAALYRAHYDGARIDNALLQVYGFDQNGLYNEWRVENGLKALELTAPPSATTVPSVDATRAPIALPGTSGAATSAPATPAPSTDAGAATTAEPTAETAAAADESGSNTTTAIIVAAVAALLALLLGGGALLLLRSGSGGDSGGGSAT